jgi:hypothetical protein
MSSQLGLMLQVSELGYAGWTCINQQAMLVLGVVLNSYHQLHGDWYYILPYPYVSK